ncbi:hypothetical protein FOZ63_030752 [Perkinsus olseni]|uniref:EF-hand domain-containing protein n=1 Tax=Perkinsus olseni TaxID=32597 RepID=A0A7J6Q1R3_PEROL|nr:hypothetical protein FOZ63_030752 [Perkinsus olseni]
MPIEPFQRGGVLVREEALRVAWDFFDTKGAGKITVNDLKERLVPFNKNITSKDLKFMMNNQNEMTFKELFALLRGNQLTGFDPAAEAFKMYDPENTGYVNMDTVKEFFGSAGYGTLSDDDTKTILQAADADGDGKLGLEDFHRRASPTVAVPVDTTLTPPPTPKTGERPRMVSQASCTVLHNSMVTRYGERMLDDGVVSYSLLESMGMWIGERLGKQELDTMYPEQRASLERDDLAVKNVCKHLWPRLYGKQADRLQTDNRGSYVIHDNGFAPIEEVVKAGVNYNDVEATPPHVVNRIEQTLELPKGVIAGYLAALGHPCYVGYFDITEAPVVGGCCFKVTMAADAEQQQQQQPPTCDSDHSTAQHP